MNNGYCESPEFVCVTEPIARKRYFCCECHQPIHIGEKHVRCSGKRSNGIFTERQHTLCAEACECIRDSTGECLSFGGLFDYVEDSDVLDVWNKPHEAKFRSLWAGIKLRIRKERRNR